MQYLNVQKMRNNFDTYQNLLWLWVATSSFVFIEPAPYDLIFILLFISAIVKSQFTFYTYLYIPFFLLILFIDCNLVSLLIAQNKTQAIKFFTITLYLFFTWVYLVSLVNINTTKLLNIIFSGYICAAVLAAIIGILAFFHFIPDYNLFLEYNRISSFFKDPNVFAPFLVPPLLFSVYNLETKNNFVHRLLWLLTLIVLLMGILLSLSRAAWANCFISLFIYLCFPSRTNNKFRVLTISCLVFLVIPIIFAVINLPQVENIFKTRLGIQSYDYARFSTHRNAIKTVMNHFFGIGPGNAKLLLNYDTHNLYYLIASENGLLAIFAFAWFLLLTVLRSIIQSCKKGNINRHYNIITSAALIGILFNSYFIDSLHWRHFWLLIALPWLPNNDNDNSLSDME